MNDNRFAMLVLNTNTQAGQQNQCRGISSSLIQPSPNTGTGPLGKPNYTCTHKTETFYSGGGLTDYKVNCTNDYKATFNDVLNAGSIYKT